MKIKPKNAITAGIVLVVFILALIAAYGFGFSSIRSALRIGYVGHEGWDSWSASYVKLDGTMKKVLHPQGDTLSISAETESGTISIEVTDKDSSRIFEKENIGTDDFEINVSGRVEVRIEADDHQGSFDIH